MTVRGLTPSEWFSEEVYMAARRFLKQGSPEELRQLMADHLPRLIEHAIETHGAWKRESAEANQPPGAL